MFMNKDLSNKIKVYMVYAFEAIILGIIIFVTKGNI